MNSGPELKPASPTGTDALAERAAALANERSDLIALIGEQADDLARLRKIIARQNRALRRAQAMAEAGYRHKTLAQNSVALMSPMALAAAFFRALRRPRPARALSDVRHLDRVPALPKAAPRPDSAGGPPALSRAREKPLQPFPGWATLGRSGPRLTLLVVLIALPDETVEKILTALEAEQRRKPNFAPVFITTSAAFPLFRRHGFTVEHLPAESDFARLAPDLDWERAITERAHLFYQKWRPDLVVVFGAASPAIVSALRGPDQVLPAGAGLRPQP